MKKIFHIKYLLIVIFLLSSGMAGAQDIKWTKTIGGASLEWGLDIAVDSSGNVFVSGYTWSDTILLDPGGSRNPMYAYSGGNADAFIAKYDVNGNILWAKVLGSTFSNVYGHGIAVDGDGNVYATGYFSAGSIDVNPGGSGGTLTPTGGNDDIFLAKYDGDGKFLWAKAIGSARHENSVGLAVDAAGNVYITGFFGDWFGSVSTDFNPGGTGGTLTTVGAFDMFVAKYDPSGTFLWAKNMGGIYEDYGRDIAIDCAGNIFVTGSFQQTADFGSTTLTSSGRKDIFLAKYDALGNPLWAISMGDFANDEAWGVATDASGNVYITGGFEGLVDFDPGAGSSVLISSGGLDAFLAKYDANGNYLWAKKLGSTGMDQGYDVTVDYAGHVWATGYFSGDTTGFRIDNGEEKLVAVNGTEIYIAKLDYEGNHKWLGGWVGGSVVDSDEGWAIAADRSGNAYATGHFEETVNSVPDTGAATLRSSGYSDLFLVKLANNDTVTPPYTVVAECAASYEWYGETYTTSGIYTHNFSTAIGCDSTVVYLDLTLYVFEEPFIRVNEFVLEVSGTYRTYQWSKNGTDIPGATNPTYTVTENAYYQVRVTDENGCEGTSAIYEVTNVGIAGGNDINRQTGIYPNPAKDRIYIQWPVKVNVVLTSIDGKVLLTETDVKQLSLQGLAAGTYFLQIRDKYNHLIKTEKVVKH